MRIPVIKGVIDRRILVNYRVAPQAMARVLPAPFHPKLVNGFAIGGICLIRLKHIRPRISPLPWGLCSENAAHRIAVEWEAEGGMQHGVYIPRRDTNSRLNTLAGGRIFPGVHHHAAFDVREANGRYEIRMQSADGGASLSVSGQQGATFAPSSIFGSLTASSQFFEAGSLGYSDAAQSGRFDGLELRCRDWSVTPLHVEQVHSSYFDDAQQFPPGSVEFDCALLMCGVQHEWRACRDLCCKEASPSC